MTREEREQAARTLQEFYDFNKTLTPQGDSWLQADITINRYTQEELGKALPTAIAALRGPEPDPATGLEGCWHCRNIEAHRIEYVIAVRTKGGTPMNTPGDCPYHYCPACGRKVGKA